MTGLGFEPKPQEQDLSSEQGWIPVEAFSSGQAPRGGRAGGSLADTAWLLAFAFAT